MVAAVGWARCRARVKGHWCALGNRPCRDADLGGPLAAPERQAHEAGAGTASSPVPKIIAPSADASLPSPRNLSLPGILPGLAP